MLDTVPSISHLSDVIVPQEVKPVNVTLDLAEDGTLILSGYIRVREGISEFQGA